MCKTVQGSYMRQFQDIAAKLFVWQEEVSKLKLDSAQYIQLTYLEICVQTELC